MAQGVFPAPPQVPFSRSELITTSTTWTHPDGLSVPRYVRMIVCGGGSGGGSGCANLATATGNPATGGSGGGSGLIQLWEGFISSTLTTTIGAGGAGGASVQRLGAAGAGTTSGNNGASGGTTIVSGSSLYVTASTDSMRIAATDLSCGGRAGAALATVAGGTGMSVGGGVFSSGLPAVGGSFGFASIWATNGGVSAMNFHSNSTVNPLNGLAPLAIYASGGGGAGGSIDTAGTLNAATAGGKGFLTYDGASGGAGQITVTANGTATGTAGSNATGLGAGGGGGGVARVINATITLATATSGAGGNGGAGYVLIYY